MSAWMTASAGSRPTNQTREPGFGFEQGVEVVEDRPGRRDGQAGAAAE